MHFFLLVIYDKYFFSFCQVYFIILSPNLSFFPIFPSYNLASISLYIEYGFCLFERACLAKEFGIKSAICPVSFVLIINCLLANIHYVQYRTFFHSKEKTISI